MKWMVVTMYGENYKELADFTVPNMVEYCHQHGYDYHPYTIKLDKDEDWAYKKHEAFKWMLQMGIDAIFYKDVDSIFTNMTVPLESFLDKENDYYITQDFNEINNGVLIIKNSEQGRWVNDAILGVREYHENEQNALNYLMMSPEFNQWIKILPQSSMNAYDYSLYPECSSWVGKEDADWKEGDFILHVPAIQPLSKRLEILKNAVITR